MQSLMVLGPSLLCVVVEWFEFLVLRCPGICRGQLLIGVAWV